MSTFFADFKFPARADFYRRVLEKARSIPGVIAAGYTTYLPLTNRGGTSGFRVESAPEPTPDQDDGSNHRVISAEYLQTMGVRLRAGRYFTRFDGPQQAPVALCPALA
jgi:putative ABC transport system permease protein